MWVKVYEDADGCPCNTGSDIAPRELSSFAEFHLGVFPFEVNKQKKSVCQTGRTRPRW